MQSKSDSPSARDTSARANAVRPANLVASALLAAVPVAQLRLFSRRQRKVAAEAYLIALVLMGVVGETLPGASMGRVVPVTWWNWVTLALSPPLIALIVATFVTTGDRRWIRRRDKVQTGVGGFAGTVAMACPVCNPIAIPIFGAAGILSFLAPLRGVIALASIALLALTLALRLRTMATCKLPGEHSSWDPAPGQPGGRSFGG
ncbi:MAG: hypothetical protein M0027_01100 [Candidatus Dormibacteraeota bacterium]|nr:hypothetical protein [Candidatus Dormibacteraeota bacterium]